MQPINSINSSFTQNFALEINESLFKELLIRTVETIIYLCNDSIDQ